MRARWSASAHGKLVVGQALDSLDEVGAAAVGEDGWAEAEQPRAALRLSLGEREEISRGLLAGESWRVIAAGLGRSPSTVSREVAANGGGDRYRAWRADERAIRRAHRPKVAKLALCRRLRHEVERRLVRRWSPQQIAARLVIDYPDDPEMRVSHETIYQSLFVQARGALHPR